MARRLGPAGTSVVSTVADMLRFAALHLDDPTLTTLRRLEATPRIHGWLDGWCLGWGRFDWEGGRVWGWDSVLSGERAVLRLVPERHAAVVLMTNSDTGRALYRSLFADLMQSLFEISVPPLRLDAEPGTAGELSGFAGVYAWPGRRIEVTAAQTCLRIKSEDAESEALPLDERTFVVDPMDPDNPTVTFGAFDAAGRRQSVERLPADLHHARHRREGVTLGDQTAGPGDAHAHSQPANAFTAISNSYVLRPSARSN